MTALDAMRMALEALEMAGNGHNSIIHMKMAHDNLSAAIAEMERAGGGCTLAGPGRGDCEHFIGLPGLPEPGQHDGDDDTVDAYGKPNGWCWSCWKSYRIAKLEDRIRELKAPSQGIQNCSVTDNLRSDADKFCDANCASVWDHHPDCRYGPNKCPGCGGPADNGHDRELPPNPYYCSRCSKALYGLLQETWK